jgi:hypothetical protein
MTKRKISKKGLCWIGAVVADGYPLLKESGKTFGEGKIPLLIWMVQTWERKKKLPGSNRAIAEASGVSYGTVAATMKMLNELGKVTRDGGGYAIVMP